MPQRQYDENTLLISREERFLQKDVFRIDVTAKECMSWIGKTIGSLVLNSFKNDAPIKAVCLYGNYGSGKSFLANEILQGLFLWPPKNVWAKKLNRFLSNILSGLADNRN